MLSKKVAIFKEESDTQIYLKIRSKLVIIECYSD